ncbi:hypothetical protein B0H13DRAFT_1880391 [Mycena leptocephala]|nr:hypothetical protein B0H13DRAFT_1880391 [Mycena leptocephala]
MTKHSSSRCREPNHSEIEKGSVVVIETRGEAPRHAKGGVHVINASENKRAHGMQPCTYCVPITLSAVPGIVSHYIQDLGATCCRDECTQSRNKRVEVRVLEPEEYLPPQQRSAYKERNSRRNEPTGNLVAVNNVGHVELGSRGHIEDKFFSSTYDTKTIIAAYEFQEPWESSRQKPDSDAAHFGRPTHRSDSVPNAIVQGQNTVYGLLHQFLLEKPSKTLPQKYGFLLSEMYGLWSIRQLWVSIMAPTWWTAKRFMSRTPHQARGWNQVENKTGIARAIYEYRAVEGLS